jgi:hypothetical protein
MKEAANRGGLLFGAFKIEAFHDPSSSTLFSQAPLDLLFSGLVAERRKGRAPASMVIS